jgi:glutathione S-transferase
VFLAEKGLDYEFQQVNPFAPPEGWRAISPLGRIPAFKDGELVINDSSVICAYLERRFPRPALYPSDDYEYARALWLEEYSDGGVVPVGGPKIFLQLVLRPLMTQKPVDEATEAAAQKCVDEELPAFFDYYESQLGDREFLVGDRLTIADIAVASPFVNMRHAGPSFKAAIEEETPIFGKRQSLIQD